jgi:ABC-type sugar transport system permease subunit
MKWWKGWVRCFCFSRRPVTIFVNFLLGLGLGYVSFKALKHVSVFVIMLLSSFLLSNVMLGLALASALQEASVIVSELASAFYLTIFRASLLRPLGRRLDSPDRRWSPEK